MQSPIRKQYWFVFIKVIIFGLVEKNLLKMIILAGATMKGSPSENSSFICGLVPDAMGTNVPIPMKEKVNTYTYFNL